MRSSGQRTASPLERPSASSRRSLTAGFGRAALSLAVVTGMRSDGRLLPRFVVPAPDWGHKAAAPCCRAITDSHDLHFCQRNVQRLWRVFTGPDHANRHRCGDGARADGGKGDTLFARGASNRFRRYSGWESEGACTNPKRLACRSWGVKREGDHSWRPPPVPVPQGSRASEDLSGPSAPLPAGRAERMSPPLHRGTPK